MQNNVLSFLGLAVSVLMMYGAWHLASDDKNGVWGFVAAMFFMALGVHYFFKNLADFDKDN